MPRSSVEKPTPRSVEIAWDHWLNSSGKTAFQAIREIALAVERSVLYRKKNSDA